MTIQVDVSTEYKSITITSPTNMITLLSIIIPVAVILTIAVVLIHRRGKQIPEEIIPITRGNKDGNKFNNNSDNLDIIFREEHEIEHGKVLYENGKKYIRLVTVYRHRKQTNKAILIGGKYGTWYP